MQQVVVPQFLDVEDKILGPITVRQFLELMIGGLIIVVFYQLFDITLFVISSLVVLAISVVFAFARINGQPFHVFLLNFIQTLRNPKLKIWKKSFEVVKGVDEGKEVLPVAHLTARQRVSASKISEIALIIDTGGMYRGENGNNI